MLKLQIPLQNQLWNQIPWQLLIVRSIKICRCLFWIVHCTCMKLYFNTYELGHCSAVYTHTRWYHHCHVSPHLLVSTISYCSMLVSFGKAECESQSGFACIPIASSPKDGRRGMTYITVIVIMKTKHQINAITALLISSIYESLVQSACPEGFLDMFSAYFFINLTRWLK